MNSVIRSVITICIVLCFSSLRVFASGDASSGTKDTVPTILAAKYYDNTDGTQEIEWYLLSDTKDNLYISKDLKSKSFICSFPNAISYKFGIRQNGDIIAVFRSEFTKPDPDRYGPELDDVRQNPYVLLNSENYQVLHEVDFGSFHPDTEEGIKPCGWLENCGFCSLPNGDVLFAEYTRMSVVYSANCWRIKAGADLTDPDNWQIVKQYVVAKDDSEKYSESVIEHFHAVQLDPFTGIIYLTTGDSAVKSQVWYSRDNGETWTQQSFIDPESGRRVTSGEKLFRLLNYNFTKDYVYWSSDSPKQHRIFRCGRTSEGELDPDGITVLADLERLQGNPATYGTVLYPEQNFMVLMERCDANTTSMYFRVLDFTDNTVKTIDTINVAGDRARHIGFRTEYTEFNPGDGIIKVGFGSSPNYRNFNDLCGNAGSSDWTRNVNNLWIRVVRNSEGIIVAEYGFYQL